MAVENVFDATTSWVADIDPGPRKILAHRYPDVPNLGDVTRVDWSQVEPVDIIAGGYPCQPFSQAGRRQGQADDRHLWPNVADILAIIRPRIVVFENVRGHLTLGFDEVVRDLHQLGYDIQWTLLRASDIGACHQRARLFILGVRRERRVCGWSDRRGRLDWNQSDQSGHVRHPPGCGGPAAHPRDGADGALPLGGVVGTGGKPVRTDSVRGPVPRERNDGGGTRLRPDLTLLPTPTATPYGNNQSPSPGAAVRPSLDSLAKLLPTPRSSDTNGGGAHGEGGLDLRTAIALLPTPGAIDAGGGPKRIREDGRTEADHGPALRDVTMPPPSTATNECSDGQHPHPQNPDATATRASPHDSPNG